jgi:hypothetical protein
MGASRGVYLWWAVAVRSEHGWDRLAACLCHRDTRYALDDTWLFHECGIELRGDYEGVSMITIGEFRKLTSADNSTVITREARVGWRGRRSTPEVVGCIRQEVHFGLVEER